MSVEGDVVLVYYEDQPAVYGRIEAVAPDVKKDWYRVTVLLLTMPAQPVTWILREAYIRGEPFTMGGKPMRLEPVKRVGPPSPPREEGPPQCPGGALKPAKVIPFKKG